MKGRKQRKKPMGLVRYRHLARKHHHWWADFGKKKPREFYVTYTLSYKGDDKRHISFRRITATSPERAVEKVRAEIDEEIFDILGIGAEPVKRKRNE